MLEPSGFVYQLGDRIGSGAYSHVFQARETSTGSVVALKKSRVSLKVRRSLMEYEAHILQLVAGHPSIPPVIAYGRFEHFEYLALDLLGPSLGDAVRKEGKLPLQDVLRIADQILSALQHIHSRQIVHRDIKPDNILASKEDCGSVYLIDFGIARPCLQGNPSIHNLIEERRNPVGTLIFASLNAHGGIDLGPRDDLESLAYTLLFMMRGDLPWQRYNHHGSALGRMAQVREKKHGWSGSRLAEGFPPLFGQFLDYARGLRFHEPIVYDTWRTQLQSLQSIGDSGSTPTVTLENGNVKPPECPVELGQLVYVRIASQTSIEGYSIQAGDPSFWHDPELSTKEWNTSSRPAIVIETEFDKWSCCHMIQIVSLGMGTPVMGSQAIRLSSSVTNEFMGEEVVPVPVWPIPQTYCYAFPRRQWFYCLPDQTPPSVHWKIGTADVELLRKKLALPLRCSDNGALQDANPDVRHDTRMYLQGMQFFVNITALEPTSLNSAPVDVGWVEARGWFDECVKIARRRGWDDGQHWTGDPLRREEASLTDSYEGRDYSCWEDRQQGRDCSLTLGIEQKQKVKSEGELPSIIQVIA